ncbi:hypothetical protein U472_14870 [Orenia metallireducens]|jgi:hypothetical protein|uniref:DUF374 domain-containing protein n=1 Tax=Orenia metallireducens TaxID=1413210 RepID=A0A1C0A671_9FIRM|nr:lysophospholipid acyltransferase family protein [Orenia metallireducens]OCL25609.1 hypothetical protein U472_14870 [Orenia metallireducens]
MKEGLKYKIIPQFAYLLQRITSGTLKIEVKNKERLLEAKESGKSIILAFWHGQLWFPAYYLQDQGYVGLASQSRDGEYISRVLKKMGWEMVRGSTSRGGARSLLKLIKKLKAGKNIAITPDGPRGPRYQAQAGVVYLAQKSNSVIIPGGVAFSKEKVFNSWDKFQLPLPFSKVALAFGESIEVEDNLSDDKLEEYRKSVEDGLNKTVKTAKDMLGEMI